MPPEPYRCLRIEREHGVATLTLDHPPINLFDAALIGEMDRAGRELAADDAVKVVLIRSDDPEFFIAHADVELILQLPIPAADAQATGQPSGFQSMVDRFRSMPKATIALIEGVCRGGGSARFTQP
jgi:enoyl-CoA hydratase/carnithine racemase